MVIADIASTTTTALGTMTGSCLPLMETLISSLLLLTVVCSFNIEGVALKLALIMISLPSLMPPSIPPAWFEHLVMVLLFVTLKPSLSADPVFLDTAMPSPI